MFDGHFWTKGRKDEIFFQNFISIMGLIYNLLLRWIPGNTYHSCTLNKICNNHFPLVYLYSFLITLDVIY